MEQGFEFFVVTDATASRTLESEKACLDRLRATGMRLWKQRRYDRPDR
jgi:hypothetical protein